MHPSIESDLNEWLSYIEAIHPTEIDLGLDRLKAVADRMLAFKAEPFVFTVAGTNGKGTTTAALNALSLAAGKTVGWYTSPHLFKFNERIQINGQCVSDTDLVEAFTEVEAARGSVSLSYFEYTTLAAFWLFDRAQLSVWVLEVGLGGRLDAVNIIDPDISIVTTIGIDHIEFLGNNLELIGREKAGICRAGKPLVLGSTSMPDSLFEVAKQHGAKLCCFGDEHYLNEGKIHSRKLVIDSLKVAIPHDNAATALQAFSFSPFELSAAQAYQAIASIKMNGRLQQLSYLGHTILLDVGHNPHAAKYIASKLGEKRLHFIVGMLHGKDIVGYIEHLHANIDSLSLVTLNVPRGCSADELKQALGSTDASLYGSVEQAIYALHQTYPDQSLFIGGSFYTVSDALVLMERHVGS